MRAGDKGRTEESGRRMAGAGVALAVLVVLAYLPAARCGFIWDDDHYVVENPTLRTTGGLLAIWLRPGATPQYYPLVFTTFWVEYQMWGLAPAGYHWGNVLLHAANTVLLWLVLRRLEVPGAWAAAAVFGLHPVHVESVAWVTERKNVLSGLFFLSSLLAYLRFTPLEAGEPPPVGRWRWFALAFLLFVAALLSKTVTCSLPAVLLLLIWWKRGKIGWADVLPLLPFFAVGLAGGLFTAWMEKSVVGAVGDEWRLSGLQRVLVAGRALWFYACSLVWPANLTFIYPRWEVDGRIWWQWLFPVAALGVIVWLWLGRGRLGRGPLVAVLCFAGCLVPALGFFDVYPFRYSFVADHFQYLPSAALIALLVAMIASLPLMHGSHAGPAATAAVLLVLGLLTREQIKPYVGLEVLWVDTLRKNPACWMAHNNLANLHLERGDLASVLKHSEAALRIKPDSYEPWGTKGNALIGLGRLDDAEAHFRSFVKKFPDKADALGALGHVLAMRDKAREAERCFREALALSPSSVEANLHLGMLLAREGKVAEALPYLRAAAADSHLNADPHYHLGEALARSGDLDAAIRSHREAVSLVPDEAHYRFGLALALLRRGKPGEAGQECREAMRRDRQWPRWAGPVVLALATSTDAGARNADLALEIARTLVSMTRGTEASPLMLLAAALAEDGQYSAAHATASEALRLARAARQPELERQLGEHLQSYARNQPIRSKDR